MSSWLCPEQVSSRRMHCSMLYRPSSTAYVLLIGVACCYLSFTRYDATMLATPQAFVRDPSLVWEFYHWRRQVRNLKQHRVEQAGMHIACSKHHHHTTKSVVYLSVALPECRPSRYSCASHAYDHCPRSCACCCAGCIQVFTQLWSLGTSSI